LATKSGNKYALKISVQHQVKEKQAILVGSKAMERISAAAEQDGKQYFLKFYGTIQEEQYVGVILEYIDGCELFQYVMDNHRVLTNVSIGIEEHLVKGFMRQLVSGLKFLHGIGIAHGDLKLENIMVDQNLSIKIIDFGLASDISRIETRGSEPYLSPETAMNLARRGDKCDIWALGVIMFCMCTARMPFDPTLGLRSKLILDSTEHRAMLRHIAIGDIKFNAIEKEFLSEGCCQAIRSLLKRNPTERNLDNPVLNQYIFTE
jgi:serine/threonine protein kinase